MTPFADLLSQGAAHAWLFIPSAIFLGALHGLEPGHSKTMMAAFIVAIRGTVKQAVLLGVAATISHTAIVWGIALTGMYLWRGVQAETLEPYFQLLSGLIIIGVALWMVWRTYTDRQSFLDVAKHAHGDDHDHDHGHHHCHGSAHHVNTGHGQVELSIFEDGVPPRWQLKTISGHHWHDHDVTVTTTRADGSVETFTFVDRGGYLESVDEIPEPHEFVARLSLGHGGHSHDYDLPYSEHHHAHEGEGAFDMGGEAYEDAHQRAHGLDIERRFKSQNVTNWQIALFGLTGGLIPCPAAITVLLLCLQLREISLGAVLVLCFSIGLAITLVSVGVVAALSVRHAGTRFPWLSKIASRAPYISGVLILLVGFYVCWHGLAGLQANGVV